MRPAEPRPYPCKCLGFVSASIRWGSRRVHRTNSRSGSPAACLAMSHIPAELARPYRVQSGWLLNISPRDTGLVSFWLHASVAVDTILRLYQNGSTLASAAGAPSRLQPCDAVARHVSDGAEHWAARSKTFRKWAKFEVDERGAGCSLAPVPWWDSWLYQSAVRRLANPQVMLRLDPLTTRIRDSSSVSLTTAITTGSPTPGCS